MRRDHPRIRGKDPNLWIRTRSNAGSPPHTRERRSKAHAIHTQGRITPAYAGKTHHRNGETDLHEDHPRIRGKDVFVRLCILTALGSPPHTRERPKLIQGGLGGHGITPAYAGKTPSPIDCCDHFRDHPRIRGKDACDCSGLRVVLGSPPHTRERLAISDLDKPDLRITPAYAGKTLNEILFLALREDHPRIRGKD